MFSDFTVKDAGPVLEGPSFFQWMKASGWREDGQQGSVSPDGYYSRKLFGRYLNYVYGYVLSHLPEHVRVRHVRSVLEAADRRHDGSWSIVDLDGEGYLADYLFNTTGHGLGEGDESKLREIGQWVQGKDSHARIIDVPYPVREKLETMGSGVRVGIEGMGLTFFDVVSELTTGRGGVFDREGDGLTYIPSGNEPFIAAYSRSGIPLSARASNQKGVEGQFHARFLLPGRIADIRSQGKIDFSKDILPLLLADMEYAYYSAYIAKRSGCIEAMRFCNDFVSRDAVRRSELVRATVPEEDRFTWERFVSPVPSEALTSRVNFRGWILQYLERDIRNAKGGNVSSPVKAASDVLRDVRDIVRAAIDYGGLSESSHRWLLSEFVPAMNRIAVGPPKERIEEMLALVRAGVLMVDFGPGAFSSPSPDGRVSIQSRCWPDYSLDVDFLVKARISMPHVGEGASGLIGNLLKAGYCRPFYNGSFNPGGLEVNRSFNIVSASGESIDNVWALGIPTEGVKFYTFVVPRPGVNSTALVDAGRAVRTMLSMIRKSGRM